MQPLHCSMLPRAERIPVNTCECRLNRARRRANDITGRVKESIEQLIEDVKETTDEIIEEGVELTRGKEGRAFSSD